VTKHNSDPQGSEQQSDNPETARRRFLKNAGATAAVGAAGATAAGAAIGNPAWGGRTMEDAFQRFFQEHYIRMTDEEITDALHRIERRTQRLYGVETECKDVRAIPGTYFAYALNISKCRGYRDCVWGCVKENNQDRGSSMEYIRVLEMEWGDRNLEHSNHYYDHETVPHPGKWYMPVQCQQCGDPPCVLTCPTNATWKDTDGIVVVDYDWCIGCRMCMTSCPYWARRFNWRQPEVPAEQINPHTAYLGNRLRDVGVVEKCHFCVQRTREGMNPACLEACPTGARVFGNLLDPNSDIRYILENKVVFRLKEEVGTEPSFFYFSDQGRARS